MFETTKKDLVNLLQNISTGDLQLPDFQRDYIWQDQDVRSLISSIAKGFPIGALLTLETGGKAVKFKPRVLEGVETQNSNPQELLLDGQQRMTSLHQAAFNDKPLRTKNDQGKLVKRYYYLDINKAVQEEVDFEEAIVGVPEDKKIRSNFGRSIQLDLTTSEAEYENDLFPLNMIFSNEDWYYDWRDYWKARGRDVAGLDRSFFKDGIIKTIQRYEMPIIRLDKDNTREAICTVFEKVNVGGKKLDAFELVTAMYAGQQFDLREDWLGNRKEEEKKGRRQRIVGPHYERKALSNLQSTDFLQACTLLYTRDRRLQKEQEGYQGKELPKISCTRGSLLSLPLEDGYKKYADSVEKGFIEASKFLNEQFIFRPKDVPYPPLVIGLAATFAILGQEADSAENRKKLERWFWSATLGELYGSTTESRLAKDVPQLVSWIRQEGDKPDSIKEAIFQQNRLYSLRTRNSAAYKGLHALLMKHGCKDFISGKSTSIMTYNNDPLDIHHVFPQDWCKKQGINRNIYDSIVNKTPLSEKSNRSVGAKGPSEYIRKIEEKDGLSSDHVDSILSTHLIEPEYLRSDDFDQFFKARLEALTSLIDEVMDNKVVRETGSNEEEYDPVEAIVPEEETVEQ